MAETTPPSGKRPSDKQGAGPTGPVLDVELLNVVVTRDGRQVRAQWALHPQMKLDLRPEELKELSELMAKVTGLVGNRFAQILSEAEPDKPGMA
jgi:hypothetical protein